MSDYAPQVPDPLRRLLRCNTCGTTVMHTAEEMLAYTRQGWPKCCGEVMALYVESPPADADRTPLDTPRLSE